MTDKIKKIKPTRIRIERAEGVIGETGKVSIDTRWDDTDLFVVADQVLYGMSQSAPTTGGYDKCDFTIEFADGETYEGRYDMQGVTPNQRFESLSMHVRRFLSIAAGRYRPADLSVERYRAIHKHQPEEHTRGCGEWLDKYELGGPVLTGGVPPALKARQTVREPRRTEPRCKSCLDVPGKDGLGKPCKTCGGSGYMRQRGIVRTL